MEDHEPSSLQRQWEITTSSFHEQLRKKIALAHTMSAGDIAHLANAINTHFWTCKAAALLDSAIEKEQAKFE